MVEVIRAYGMSSIMVVVMLVGQPSAVNSVPFVTAAVGVGFSGSVMLIIWTPSSRAEVTRAYVEESIVIVVMPPGESRVVKPS